MQDAPSLQWQRAVKPKALRRLPWLRPCPLFAAALPVPRPSEWPHSPATGSAPARPHPSPQSCRMTMNPTSWLRRRELGDEKKTALRSLQLLCLRGSCTLRRAAVLRGLDLQRQPLQKPDPQSGAEHSAVPEGMRSRRATGRCWPAPAQHCEQRLATCQYDQPGEVPTGRPPWRSPWIWQLLHPKSLRGSWPVEPRQGAAM
mmetsp:Transcript_79667/g.191167  ORF Transcript_79667/g.191167 Transcript_79667/m.191167 type:complete len:201 (-) Transcript_79667:1006-1608(-)